MTASDAAPGMWFGKAVAISGETIVVGMLLTVRASGRDQRTCSSAAGASGRRQPG